MRRLDVSRGKREGWCRDYINGHCGWENCKYVHPGRITEDMAAFGTAMRAPHLAGQGYRKLERYNSDMAAGVEARWCAYFIRRGCTQVGCRVSCHMRRHSLLHQFSFSTRPQTGAERYSIEFLGELTGSSTRSLHD